MAAVQERAEGYGSGYGSAPSLRQRLLELCAEVQDTGPPPWGRWRLDRLSSAAEKCVLALDNLQKLRIGHLLRRLPPEERQLYLSLLGEWQRELHQAEAGEG
jgi:hypothetical protein